MKPYLLALFAIIALTAASIFLVARRPSATVTQITLPAPAQPPATTPPTLATPSAPPSHPTVVASQPGTDSPTLPASDLTPSRRVATDANHMIDVNAEDADPLDRVRGAIHHLAASNNPGNVVALAAYLDHADADIREEARIGLIMLGAKSGGPFLTSAAAKARTSEEAEKFREAAEFLLNPPAPPSPEPAEPADMPEPDFVPAR